MFPKGVRYVNIKITGVHGTEDVRVGMGMAYFATECTDGTIKRWRCEHAIYNKNSPVNLICMNKILFVDGNHTIETGHDVNFKSQYIALKKGRKITMKKNNRTELYEIKMMPETAEYVHQHDCLLYTSDAADE